MYMKKTITNIEEIIKKGNQGDQEAQFQLERYYSTNDHNEEAIKWCKLAAEQGNVDALNRLGNYYWNGNKITQDKQEALRFFRLAADQGSAHAQRRIGECYYKGDSVEQNYDEATVTV